MFRLENDFWKIFEKKYRELPVQSTATGKALKFSVPNLTESIQQFISTKLQRHDDELFKIFIHRNKNRGYNKDNLYRLFKINNPEWNPSRDLIDLLCFYCFDKSYENSVRDGQIKNNIDLFRFLKTDRSSIEAERQELSDKIENKLLSYHQKKVDLAINFLEDFELSLESFDKHDLEILKQIQPLKESLGDVHWDIIENRFFVNPNIVRGLKVVTPVDKVIVGFFILYPITKKCQMEIDKGEITKSDEFGFTDICKDFKTASAIYISLVFAVDRYSKAFLLLKLKDELLNILSEHPNIKIIYVRPATEDGLRNIEKNKFLRLKNSPTLYFQKPEHILNRQAT